MTIDLDGVAIELVRKRIKNINLRINHEGKVKVSAPIGCSDGYIQDFLQSKRHWIHRHTARYLTKHTKPFQYINGENHFYLGRAYILILKNQVSDKRIILDDSYLYVFADKNASAHEKESFLTEWYRTEIKKIIPSLIKKWEPIIGVSVNEWGVKKMKTRWGTCNTVARRIWLNLSLIEKPIQCLEYVVVHEMVHLLEASHNKRFYALMTRFMPDWKVYKNQLL